MLTYLLTEIQDRQELSLGYSKYRCTSSIRASRITGAQLNATRHCLGVDLQLKHSTYRIELRPHEVSDGIPRDGATTNAVPALSDRHATRASLMVPSDNPSLLASDPA